jgi:hypothetical protein
MTFEPDRIQYPSAESTDALFTPGLLFSPPDAPSPELFDQEFAELDLNFPFKQSDDFFPAFRGFSPAISPVSAPLTYSTTCAYGTPSSHYSSDLTRSGFMICSDLEDYSLNNGLHGTHDSIHSSISSNGLPSIPPPHPADAQFGLGTSFLNPNFFGISPEDSSTAMQPLSPPLSVHHMTPDSEEQAQMAPAPGRPLRCPQSPHCKEETISMNDWLTLLATSL